MLLSAPDILSHLFKTTPKLLAQTLRDDPTLLAMAFTLVPHSLSDTLEKHPEFFVDVAHRRPVLVTRLFAKYPDLLMVGPLEPFFCCSTCAHYDTNILNRLILVSGLSIFRNRSNPIRRSFRTS